ncbi:MAG TPA: hypothetical protein VEC38_15430 [Candidatus Binataceae bacterium]|nr:hypothetical protein [Candidatus Binataceae bacterium]
MALTANAAASPRDIAALAKSSLIYIATVRKDGNQSKPAPVWFITTKDNEVLIETSPKSWKARRIKRGSPAIIWIGSMQGPAFIGKAEIAADPAIQSRIVDEYPRKYLLARMGFARPTKEKFAAEQIVAIRITPLRDLPDGFQSHPGAAAPSIDAEQSASKPQ